MAGLFTSVVIFVFSVAQIDKNVLEGNDFYLDSIVKIERAVSVDNKGLDINAVMDFHYEQFLFDDNLLRNRRNFRMKKLRGKPMVEQRYWVVINLAILFGRGQNNETINYNNTH